MVALLMVFLTTVAVGTLLTPLVIRFAVAWGYYDSPSDLRRVHTEPLPRIGGVAVFLAVLAGVIITIIAALTRTAVFEGPTSFFFGLVLGGSILFVTGLLDDVRGLGPVTKLIAQITASLIVYAHGFRIEVLSVGPTAELPLGWMALPITVLWIVGVTNAFNLIDGLDGLASGIALVALASTLVTAVALGNAEVVFVSTALVGALIGFLRYNFSPARIFLGDSGSLFVGFMLAVLSVHGSMKSATAVVMIVPLFALAIPLLDTALAILRRWLRCVPLSPADGRHIHHRLLALGLTHRSAVILLYLVATALAVVGLLLVFAPPPAVVSVAIAGGGATLLLILYGLRRLQYHEFIEAATVIISSVSRFRQVIRDRITAQDLVGLLRFAKDLDQINAILEDNASSFQFLHMEVCNEATPGPGPLVLFKGHAARAWKLDYPVTPHDFVEGKDYVLRIWCNPQVGSTPYGAERIAGILAPVLEQWMVEVGPLRTSSFGLDEDQLRDSEAALAVDDRRFSLLERRRIGGGVEHA